VLHLGIVLEVALIAVARKIVVLDLAKYDGVRVLALSALVITLAGALYLERRNRSDFPRGRAAAAADEA
jgi:uncharacterized membrane protein (DUF373 family)